MYSNYLACQTTKTERAYETYYVMRYTALPNGSITTHEVSRSIAYDMVTNYYRHDSKVISQRTVEQKCYKSVLFVCVGADKF